jgi:hypothetical protein
MYIIVWLGRQKLHIPVIYTQTEQRPAAHTKHSSTSYMIIMTPVNYTAVVYLAL